MASALSSVGLSRIDIKSDNPLTLYNDWRAEAENNKVKTNIMALATSTRNGSVSNRNVVLRLILDGGFVFVTNIGSKKAQDIKENPVVAATFLWMYNRSDSTWIQKQVRIKGEAVELPRDVTDKLYKESPPTHQIRTHLCYDMGEPIELEELEKRRQKLLKELADSNKDLEAPDYEVAYKIVPDTMEFYHSTGIDIADRVLFTKCNGAWSHVHLVT